MRTKGDQKAQAASVHHIYMYMKIHICILLQAFLPAAPAADADRDVGGAARAVHAVLRERPQAVHSSEEGGQILTARHPPHPLHRLGLVPCPACRRLRFGGSIRAKITAGNLCKASEYPASSQGISKVQCMLSAVAQ